MKQQFISLLLLSLLLVGCGDQKSHAKSYALDWKIAADEVLAYQTAMNPVDNSGMTFNFDDLFADTITMQLLDQLASLTTPRGSTMISLLRPEENGNISVKMIMADVDQPADDTNAELNDLWANMVGTVQLRGELTPDGAIASFYLQESQRNLLAIFFELPTHPVQVGDSWDIDINCLSMDNGFIAERIKHVNRVTMTSLQKRPDGKRVAVLDYVIAEMVDGKFVGFDGSAYPQTSTCSFLGQGWFLIDEGRWERFTGEMAVTSTGGLQMNTTQQFALTQLPLASVPPEYLELE